MHCVLCILLRHFGLSILAANFLNFQIKTMAERNTDWKVINDHYKKHCALIPEKLVDKDSNNILVRWFKFTLKPPYSIAHDKLRLGIWDTSFWTFWLKFGHKGP